MLDALRRGATTWVAKILFAILVLSFAIWGVADVFRGYGQGELAQVGNTEITTDEFQRAYQQELDAMSRQFGRRLTAEQARAFGLDARVLSQLVSMAAIDAHARQMQLSLSDATIAEAIRQDPMFKGPDGKFSVLALEGLLRQAGLSERGYIATRRSEDIREQLTGALLNAVVPPDFLVKLLHDYREETRTADHFVIDAEKAITIPEPDPAKLAETYESNKRRFVTPQLRTLAIVSLPITEMKKRVSITEEEVAAAYAQEKERYNVPEKRRVQQIAFPSKAEAEKAAAAIAAGKSFEEVARDAGVTAGDIELGLLARRDLIDPKIAEVAFSLPQDTVSDVVEGRFSTVLLRVAEIQPGKQRTLEEVAFEIRDRLAGEKATDALHKLVEQIEDDRAAGKPLKETAAALKLPYIEVVADREGKGPEGNAVLEGPDAQRILTAAFGGKAGVESEAVELPDGGYAWVDVIAVSEAKQKPFEAVKDEVAALWRDLERRKAIADLAAKLVERANAGESMATLASEVGGKVETAKSFKRYGGVPGLPENAVQQAFALPASRALSAETRDGASRLVLKVVDVTPAPPPSKDDLAKLQGEIARQMQGDVIGEYVAALQERLGVSVNEAVWRRTIGADRQQ
jgi:peptidyl-prolyl cis-trans isomerase D